MLLTESFLLPYFFKFSLVFISLLIGLTFSRGPGVAGIPPREASDRLSIFQARFDELWRKYITYSGMEVII